MARNLSKGTTGQDVQTLQDYLNYHLRRETPLVVDGDFGTGTSQRVIKFQTVNSLKPDGIVGPKTRAVLFEVDVVSAQVMVFPELTLPTIGDRGGNSFGISPPRLIPPLQLPNLQPPQLILPTPVSPGPQLTLSGVGSAGFIPVKQPSILTLTLTATPVQDPTDPVVSSTKSLLQAVQKVPVDAKFKATIISLIPNPVKKISEPKTGFDLGLGLPKYSPLDPNKIGQSGHAAYSLRITGKPGSPLPFVVLNGRAEGDFELRYTGQARSNYFKATLDCKFFVSLGGTF